VIHPQKPLEARISQQDAADLYDRLASFYDIWGRLTESKAQARCLELAKIIPGESVLDVAVGTGLVFERVVRRNPGGLNLGIDISRGMLAKAERRLQKAGLSSYRLSNASATEIPEPDSSIDLLLNNYMFDLLDEKLWPAVIREFRRVLKPGGRLVLANMTVSENWGSGIYQRLYTLSPKLMGGCRSVQMSGPLEQNGFTVHLREYRQQLFFPSEIILAYRSGTQ